jgi:aspartate beta-hydroxylase
MPSADRPPSPESADHELDIARRHLREGRRADAQQCFERVLAARPGNVEALRFLGQAAFARGDHGSSVTLLSNASKSEPDNIGVLVELGNAYRAGERFDAARYVLERAVSLAAGGNPYARLVLADVLERDRRPQLALLHFFRATMEAQRTRRWTTDPVDETQLRARVEHARRAIAQGRRAWFERALQGQRPDGTGARPARIDDALAMYLGEREAARPLPGQQAGPLHVPNVETSRFLDRARFAWLDEAAALIASLGDEVDACLAATSATQTHGARAIRVPILLRGNVQYEARRHTPRLLAALAALPLARIPNLAPDCEIVALAGGAQVPLHHGVSNARCRAIVGIARSAALDVVVGGERRVIHAGQAVVVDPGFGIVYANTAGTPARAIVFELWHPELSEAEHSALSALFVAAIDFDSRLQELP